MFTLRCTEKLLKHLKVKPAVTSLPSETALGDWYAKPLNLGHDRFVLCSSAKTLLPLVVRVAGGDIPGKLVAGLREVLHEIGVAAPLIEAELRHMDAVTLAKTANRSVLGWMTDLSILSQYHWADGERMSPLALSLKLARTPCVSLNLFPKTATMKALEGAA